MSKSSQWFYGLHDRCGFIEDSNGDAIINWRMAPQGMPISEGHLTYKEDNENKSSIDEEPQ